jgi:nucleoside-diphosphate-sugar epimerase
VARKMLITGCSGFIGRHAVSYALAHGYSVVGFDIKPAGIKDRRFVFVRGSVTDRKAVVRAAKGCDYVLHLAAATSLPDFKRDLHANYSINVTGFLNVIDAAKEAGCRKFAYASSSAVYLDEYAEDSVIDVKRLRNHYGKSKLINEMYADSYYDSYGLKSVGLRYFNIYGPGEDVKEMSSPITKFIMEKRKNDTITIFGDGKQAKDFTHIDDAIEITFRLIQDTGSTGVYNVGTGVATSFNRIAHLINPKKITYIKNPYLSSYIFYLKADTRRLFRSIGKYKFITVEEGISRMTGGN